jgi:hypothetical protein
MSFSSIYTAVTSLLAGVKIRELFIKKGVDIKLLSSINELQSAKSKQDRNKSTSK